MSIALDAARLFSDGGQIASRPPTDSQNLHKTRKATRRNTMNHAIRVAGPADRELEQVVEPLANYICAMEQPRLALMAALAALFREVEVTNRSALAHYYSCMQN
jgi:hypothetical protein